MPLGPPLRRVLTLLAGILAMLAFTPAFAAADSATISFTDASGNPDPVVGVGRTFTVSGNVAGPINIYVKERPAGGAPCAPSASSDSSSSVYEGSFSGDDFYDRRVEGNFSLKKTGTWSEAGTFLYCIWLAPTGSTPTVPISQLVTFRRSNGTISATLAPAAPSPDQSTTITVTGNSEAPAEIYATYRPVGAPCAISYSAETGRGIINGRDVNGAFSTTATFTPTAGGNYVLCLFIAQSSSDANPIAVQPINFTVVQPCKVPAITTGSNLGAVSAALTAAGCGLGSQTLKPDGKVARGAVIGTDLATGTVLPSGTAVGVSISDGKSCRVPSSKAGLRLSKAKAKLASLGCSVGTIKRVKSRRKKGTVVRFTPKAGSTLAPRATVNITVSRGRR